MDGGSVAGVGFVVARGDATELFDFLEEVLDQVAPFVHLAIIRNFSGSTGIGRDDGQRASLVQLSPEPVAVKGLIANQRVEGDATKQRRHTDTVVPLARQQNEAHEIAERIDQRHDLGRQTAARLADGLIFSPPFAPVPCRWTLTMVPSTSPYSKSGSCDNSSNIPSNTPLSAQRRKRFHTEDHLPYNAGRSRHGAPARAIHKTASTNRRLFFPDRPGSPSLPGRRGATRSHWASLSNCRSKADLPSQGDPPFHIRMSTDPRANRTMCDIEDDDRNGRWGARARRKIRSQSTH